MSLVLNGTDGLSDVDGSAATPAIRGTDANTGIFFPAADTIAFAEGGAEVMRIDSSGNVGIGTSLPAAKLDVSGGSLRINEDGAGTKVINVRSNYAGLGPAINVTTNDPLLFLTNNTERARIDSSGNLLVGTTSVPSGGQKMNIAGGITPTTDNSFIFGNSGLRWQALYAANGTIQTSDERQKTDIVESPLGLNFVMTLRPVAYKFKVGKNVVEKDADGNNVVTPVPGKRQHFGLLSQQVKQAVGDVDFGGWIHTDLSDPESDQGLRYDEFVAPLIKAIQEQQAIITALTARVAALEGTQNV